MPAFERCDMTVVRRLASAEGETYHERSAAEPAGVKKPAKRAIPTLLPPEGSPSANLSPSPAYAYPYVTPHNDVFLRSSGVGPRIDRLRELGHITRSEWTNALQGYAKA